MDERIVYCEAFRVFMMAHCLIKVILECHLLADQKGKGRIISCWIANIETDGDSWRGSRAHRCS